MLIKASVVKYYAFGNQMVMEKRGDGAVRWSSGTLPTDKTFTGQRSESLGLLDYKARYYSPDLGYFIHLPRWKCNVVFKKQGRLYEKEY